MMRSRALHGQRVQHTFEHPIQVLHLNRATHDRLAILEVLVRRLHLVIQRHIQDDEFHVGGGHALISEGVCIDHERTQTDVTGRRQRGIRTWVGRQDRTRFEGAFSLISGFFPKLANRSRFWRLAVID